MNSSKPTPINRTIEREMAICADDFGVDETVNAAIVDLASRGRLSATSVLVDGIAVQSAKTLLGPLPLDIGLHLNFTDAIGLLNATDVKPLARLILQAHARQLNHRWVRSGIERQFDRFEGLFGKAPDYVDGHLHVHQLPIIREVLIDVLNRRYRGQKIWLRDTRSPLGWMPSWSWSERFKSWLIGHLGMSGLAKQARANGWQTNLGFAGVYDFTREHPAFEDMIKRWCAHCKTGSLIMTHPAKQSFNGDPIGQSRVDEYQVLGSEAFGEYLSDQNIRVARLSQVFSALP
jgi:predicted glycoside hydrolase/deacetylase ChbG (UPF0249 family)